MSGVQGSSAEVVLATMIGAAAIVTYGLIYPTTTVMTGASLGCAQGLVASRFLDPSKRPADTKTRALARLALLTPTLPAVAILVGFQQYLVAILPLFFGWCFGAHALRAARRALAIMCCPKATALFLLAGVLGFAGLLAATCAWTHLRIDACLDDGGRWNYDGGTCEHKP